MWTYRQNYREYKMTLKLHYKKLPASDTETEDESVEFLGSNFVIDKGGVHKTHPVKALKKKLKSFWQQFDLDRF